MTSCGSCLENVAVAHSNAYALICMYGFNTAINLISQHQKHTALVHKLYYAYEFTALYCNVDNYYY